MFFAMESIVIFYARAILLSCGCMLEYSIGVDLGGTNLRAAAIDRSGRLMDKVAGRTHLSAGREAIVGDIASSIEQLREHCGRENLTGIGVAVPGFIRIEEGVIANSNNLACLEGFPIRDELEGRLKAPVIFENDANAAALGEKWKGAGHNVDDLVLLTLGTGVGGGIICQGRILHGYLGMAGELGHITVVTNGNPCGCGNRGCLEKHASASAVIGMARMCGLSCNTAKEVYELWQQGNPRAQAIFNSVGDALGIGLAMLVNAFNFPLYLISGGLVGAWEAFAPSMFAGLKERSFTYRSTNTRVEQAVLLSEAGLYGAACLPYLGPVIAKAAAGKQ